MSKHYDMLSIIEVGPPPPLVLRVGGSSDMGSLPSFSTPFSRAILEAPCLSKVKMPYVEPFDGTTNPDGHLDVYKAQMYVLDMDNATCCRYFSATLKGIAQKWFNGLPKGSITSSNWQSCSARTSSRAKKKGGQGSIRPRFGK